MGTTGERIRVLHVDDEPDFAEMAATFLEREVDRFDVETAKSAAEGLDRLASDEFDCVVSDYEMPGQNGIEFLEAVRREDADLPFILYTGRGSEEIASEAISAGVTDYLQKDGGTSQYTVLANRIRNAVEKYRTQTELADREQRLNLFFEQSPLGVVEWDENFDFSRINDAAREILGYDEADLIGHSWEKIVPESDRDAVGEVVADLLENKGGYHSINENVRKDGERIICEWHNRVVTDDAGGVVAIFSQFQDITDRREHQRRFEAIFNNTYTFSGLCEPDGTLIEANETALSFAGLDRDDVVGKRLWNTPWIQRNDAEETIREAVEQAQDGQLFRDEVRVQGEEQEAIIDFSIRPVTDERDEVTLLVPEGRDITERKEQERENNRRRHRLEQILKTVPACVVQLDANGEFVFANDRAEDVLGLTESKLTERTYNDPEWGIKDLDGDPIPDEDLPFRQVQDTGEPITDFRHRIEWPDGTQKILLVNGAPLFDDDGNVESVVFALSDITDREQQQRRLQKTTARLEAVYEDSPDMIDILGPTGRIEDVNRRFCEELGYSENEVIGTPIWEIDRNVDQDDVEAILSDFDVGERRRFEGLYERSDGSTLSVEVHLLRLDLNDREQFVAISRDITGRKEQERKRQQIIDRVI
ncbi:MAG: PAS domain S-box protein [Halobacteriales archaeon]